MFSIYKLIVYFLGIFKFGQKSKIMNFEIHLSHALNLIKIYKKIYDALLSHA